MAIRTKEQLKSYFETGDVPTEENFSDLIDTFVTEDELNEIIEDISSFTPITYQSLLDLRENSLLVSGRFYRITDYVTTTSEENTRSAGHQFDVIVLAMTNDTLAERAWACHHDGDTYFQNSHLEAWQIWYCLDNDTSRFNWADTENGKGVIYRMIDEFNNDCPYDFKNIRFKHPNDSTTYPDYYYTFSTVISGVVEDHSHNGDYCYGNKIGHLIDNRYSLNKIVFVNSSKISSCHSNSFGNDCHSNSFGNDCHEIFIGQNCRFNTFGNGCYMIVLDNDCYHNSFGSGCSQSFLGNDSYYNSFGNRCYYNGLLESCHHNSFGNGCNNINLGNYCYSNSFGNNCHNFHLGNYCDSNSFGNSCNTIYFGNYCDSNSFGNSCTNIYFGESSEDLKSYYRRIIIDNGNSHIRLICTTTTSSTRYFQNVRIGLGVNSGFFKKINDSNVNQAFNTYYKPTNSQIIII